MSIHSATQENVDCAEKENTSMAKPFSYFESGRSLKACSRDNAEDAFWSLVDQHHPVSGPYGSWDMFWLGYFEDDHNNHGKQKE